MDEAVGLGTCNSAEKWNSTENQISLGGQGKRFSGCGGSFAPYSAWVCLLLLLLLWSIWLRARVWNWLGAKPKKINWTSSRTQGQDESLIFIIKIRTKAAGGNLKANICGKKIMWFQPKIVDGHHQSSFHFRSENWHVSVSGLCFFNLDAEMI